MKKYLQLEFKKPLLVSFTKKTRWYIYVYVRITTISNQGTELLKISNIASDYDVLIFFYDLF